MSLSPLFFRKLLHHSLYSQCLHDSLPLSTFATRSSLQQQEMKCPLLLWQKPLSKPFQPSLQGQRAGSSRSLPTTVRPACGSLLHPPSPPRPGPPGSSGCSPIRTGDLGKEDPLPPPPDCEPPTGRGDVNGIPGTRRPLAPHLPRSSETGCTWTRRSSRLFSGPVDWGAGH